MRYKFSTKWTNWRKKRRKESPVKKKKKNNKRTSESSFLLHFGKQAALTAHVKLSKQGVSKATGLDTPRRSDLLQRTSSFSTSAGWDGCQALQGGHTLLITWFTLYFARRAREEEVLGNMYRFQGYWVGLQIPSYIRKLALK